MPEKMKTVHLMGTVIDVRIEHEQPTPILEEAVARLKKYEKRFSANDPDS